MRRCLTSALAAATLASPLAKWRKLGALYGTVRGVFPVLKLTVTAPAKPSLINDWQGSDVVGMEAVAAVL